MAVKAVRYRGCVPDITDEGIFIKPIPVPDVCSQRDNCDNWHRNLNVYDRLGAHHTLASARRFSRFICTKAPRDSLDFMLESSYNPNIESFPEKIDPYIQFETLGLPTWRRLRNTVYVQPKRPIPLGHPLLIGGIKEKKDPNNVQLMNSGPHSPQTNAGYIRNGQGGNIFYY